ncbi:MAG: hypothetical protein KIH08_02875 [Candidatus Freyarchaeota archaeon]|nr:hypothetical protein [Candidatus Jordarchaeia archaeon]
MFESFLSNIASILQSVLVIVIILVLGYIFCLCLLWVRHDFLLYYMLRDQTRLVRWLINNTINFYKKHWRFALGVFFFFTVYTLFYSALPGWTETHTTQRLLISLYASTMTTATVATLVKRKMKWALRLTPTSTISITAILAYYLLTEGSYPIPQYTQTPAPELVALVLIPSIITIAAFKKIRQQIKYQQKQLYPNPQDAIHNNQVNPKHSPRNSSYPANHKEDAYKKAYFAGRNKTPTKIEKAYLTNIHTKPNHRSGRSKLTIEAEPQDILRIQEDEELRQLIDIDK